MRFAITASDRYLGVLNALVQAGWQPLKLFAPPVDGRVHRNKAVIEAAQKLGIDIQLSRLTPADLEALAAQGCEALVVASYNWKIPDWRASLKYAVNLHASPLPEARGPYPAVQALLEGRRSWAVSCHKVEPAFDSGDLLAQESFALSEADSHESLDLKIQMASRRLATRVAGDFTALWDSARAQGTGSYWKHWRAEERKLDFSRGVEDVLRQVRAFGLIECTATVNKIDIFVRRAVGWTEAHDAKPGAMVHSDGATMVVAARDGYIGIVEWSLLDPDAMTGSRLR
ncbi:MAG TPA: formyltransferase family protein [Burkholderiales bacterium]|nr:formyltransferase family protein [Burkholderiales bacterium]